MTEWKKYTGSDEQIAEMLNPISRFIVPNDRFIFNYEYFDGAVDLRDFFSRRSITHYLICNPHPLADMICQQARTGQPVWVRIKTNKISFTTGVFVQTEIYTTNTPDWNIPGAEYSFTEFKDDRDRPEPSFHGDAI